MLAGEGETLLYAREEPLDESQGKYSSLPSPGNHRKPLLLVYHVRLTTQVYTNDGPRPHTPAASQSYSVILILDRCFHHQRLLLQACFFLHSSRFIAKKLFSYCM